MAAHGLMNGLDWERSELGTKERGCKPSSDGFLDVCLRKKNNIKLYQHIDRSVEGFYEGFGLFQGVVRGEGGAEKAGDT